MDGSGQPVGGGHVQQLRRPVADQPGVDPAGGEGRVEPPGEREVVETGDGEIAPDCEPGFAGGEVEAVCHVVVAAENRGGRFHAFEMRFELVDGAEEFLVHRPVSGGFPVQQDAGVAADVLLQPGAAHGLPVAAIPVVGFKVGRLLMGDEPDRAAVFFDQPVHGREGPVEIVGGDGAGRQVARRADDDQRSSRIEQAGNGPVVALLPVAEKQHAVDAEPRRVVERAQNRFVALLTGDELEFQLLLGDVVLDSGGDVEDHRVGVGGVGPREGQGGRAGAGWPGRLKRIDPHAAVFVAQQRAVGDQGVEHPADGVAAGPVLFRQPLFRRQVLLAVEAVGGKVADENLGQAVGFAVIVHILPVLFRFTSILWFRFRVVTREGQGDFHGIGKFEPDFEQCGMTAGVSDVSARGRKNVHKFSVIVHCRKNTVSFALDFRTEMAHTYSVPHHQICYM